jgi:predicted ATP-grasp superfamily ATP-dependent carboligase
MLATKPETSTVAANWPATLPPAIIFGGYFISLAVLEGLSRRGIRVYVLNDRWAEARYSRYARPIRLPANESYPESATKFLTGAASDYLKGSVLLASGDDELEIIAKNREALAEKFLLDLSNPVAQLAMLDKLATYRAATQAGVPTPRYWEARSEQDIHNLRDHLVYPLIVKPTISHLFQRKFKGRFFVAGNFREVLESYRVAEAAGISTLLVEKILGPDSRCCSYYTYLDEEGNALFDFTKRIIRRYPKNMGVASYHITDHVDEVRELSLKLFRQVGLQGLATAEFKYDERDRQLKLIECNARFTASNSLVARAGYDLGSFVYNRVVGLPQEPLRNFRTGLRHWDPLRDFRAFLELRKVGEMSFQQWLSSIMHPTSIAYFSWRDPIPSLFRLWNVSKMIRRS